MVSLSHEETQKAVDATLDHLVLAVEAELTDVLVAGQTVEQIDVVEEALEPERARSYLLRVVQQVCDKQVGVDYGKHGRECRATHIHLVLHAVESALQRVPVRSLIGLALLDGDDVEKRCEKVHLLAIDQHQVSVHQCTQKRHQQERV